MELAQFAETALGLLGIQSSTSASGLTTFKAPDTRLKSASDARELLGALVIEDNPRSLQRALVKGMVDGHPPYNDAQRKREGRGWECNLNFMEGQAIMNRTAVPYYNLFARVDYYAECRTAFMPDHPDHETWNQKVSLRFHNMLKRWPEFNWNVQQISYWMRLHGIGFALPESDYSWRFRSIETGRVLAPMGSPSCLDKRIPYAYIRVPYRIVELWNFIKDEKTAAKKGWNVEAVKFAIKYGMKGLSKQTDWWAQPWEHYERILKNSDLVASFTDGDIVNCCVALIQEFAKPGDYGGKISKFIFTEFAGVTQDQFNKFPVDANGENMKSSFLFCDPNCYDSYAEGLIPFFRNTGDGTWHSVRGYAMEAFKHLEVDNRLLCQAINRGFLNSSVILQFPTEKSRRQSELKVFGAVVQLPPTGEFKQIALQGGLDDVVQIHRVLQNHLANNLGVFAPRQLSRDDGKGEQPTARQVDYQASSEASIGEGEITIWYQQLDALYNFMFTRASERSTTDNEAKRFQEECLEDGVPPEVFQDMEYVRANRQNGYGSPEMGIMRFNQGKDLVPMLPEDGKQMWLEDAVTALYGPEKTKRYAPRQHIPDDQDWQVSVENDLIANGKVPIIYSGQDDVIHLQGHLADATQVLTPVGQSLQQQQGMNGQAPPQDPQALAQSATYAQTMAQHVEAHIARLENDPTRKKEAKLFSDQFKQLSQFSKVLWDALRNAHRQIQIQQQQNVQATSLSALDQAKIQSIQMGARGAALKTQSQIQNQALKTAAKLRENDLKSAHGMTLDNIKTGHEIATGRIKTGHDMLLDRAQTANDIAIERGRELAVPSDVSTEQ